jgi:hypothetical protein
MLHKKYEDSSDYTSDEDFDFVENMLDQEGKLDEMTLKMMRGVIQPLVDERKRDEKPDYKKKKRKGKGGADASFSDSIDEYGDEENFDYKPKDVVIA